MITYTFEKRIHPWLASEVLVFDVKYWNEYMLREYKVPALTDTTADYVLFTRHPIPGFLAVAFIENYRAAAAKEEERRLARLLPVPMYLTPRCNRRPRYISGWDWSMDAVERSWYRWNFDLAI